LLKRMMQRRRTAALWAQINEILLAGEIGLETDTGKFKFGDGDHRWNELEYAAAESGSPESPFALKTTTEMNEIENPTEGMAIWNLTEHQLYVYDGLDWVGVPMQA